MKQEIKIVALVLSIIIISCASAGTYFYWNDVRALRIGMTIQEVIDKLGQPSSTTATKDENGLKEVYIWSYAKAGMMGSTSRTISVIFLNGKTVKVPTVPKEYQD